MMVKKDETQTLIRLPLSLLEDIKRFAEMHERSVNGELVWALRQYVEQQKKEEEKAKMAAVIDQVKPLAAWKEEIERGEKIFHASLPWERVGKNDEGWYVREYDNFSTASDRATRKFKDTTFPKFFRTFEELVDSCTEEDLWSTGPTAETFINWVKTVCSGLEEFVVEKGMDEEDIEAIEEDVRLTPEDLESIKENVESVFEEVREKGYAKWSAERKEAEAKKLPKDSQSKEESED